MTDAYIFDAVRTPRGKGKPDGSLHEVTPVALATHVLQRIRDRNELDTTLLDDVILGCVEQVGEQGACIARTATLMAGYDQSVPGVTLNRFCSSGLEAINIAAAKVRAGEARMAVAGGVESMSRVRMASSGGAYWIDPAVTDPLGFVPQGISADLIATRQGYTRDGVDAFALESQRRAVEARTAGRFTKSIEPVTDQFGRPLLDHDELIRGDTDMESLGSLKPAFEKPGAFGFDAVALQRYPEVERIEHVHTAGNSSGIVDGAAAVLVGSKEAGEKAGLKPRARLVGWTSIGAEPSIMLTAPAPSARKALGKAGMQTSDIDLWEVNEAFASVVMLFMEEMGVDHATVNVNGGAIAMGHPLGATGAVIFNTLLDEMERRDVVTGLTTLCVGGGMGTATIIERV